MEDDHRAKIVQQKAEQKAEEERLRQEDRVLQAELEYKKQIDALLTRKSTPQSKEERRQIFIKANEMKQEKDEKLKEEKLSIVKTAASSVCEGFLSLSEAKASRRLSYSRVTLEVKEKKN